MKIVSIAFFLIGLALAGNVLYSSIHYMIYYTDHPVIEDLLVRSYSLPMALFAASIAASLIGRRGKA